MSQLGRALLLGALICSGGSALHGGQTEKGDPNLGTVTVRVYPYARVPADALERAQETASRIFANAGIQLHWVACPTNGDEDENEKYAECQRRVGGQDVFVRIISSAPAQFAKYKGISGAAMLPEGGGPGRYALVFYDRVERTGHRLVGCTQGVFANAMPATVFTSVTLGMVLAHELGHLLLGANGHSKGGIMQAQWDRQDLEDRFLGRQSFTPNQVERIHRNLEAQRAANQTVLAGTTLEKPQH